MTALQSESPTGKSKSVGTVSPGTPRCQGRILRWPNSFLKPPRSFLEMSLVITKGVVASSWEAGREEMGSKVFHIKLVWELRTGFTSRHVREALA